MHSIFTKLYNAENDLLEKLEVSHGKYQYQFKFSQNTYVLSAIDPY